MAMYSPNEKIGRVFMMVDLDGTLANNDHREHLLPNWNEFHKACDKDSPNVELIKAIQHWNKQDGVTMVFVTGRTGLPEVKRNTIAWLEENGFEDPWVEFRSPKSFIKNDVLKTLTFEKLMEKSGYHEDMQMVIIEDTPKVFETFRKKFSSFIVHDVHVDLKNPELDSVKALKQCFENLGYKSVVKKRQP